MKGWECPKCGSCYAPTVRECDRCAAAVVHQFKPVETPPSSMNPNCLACGQWHPQGMACPSFKVTAVIPDVFLRQSLSSRRHSFGV